MYFNDISARIDPLLQKLAFGDRNYGLLWEPRVVQSSFPEWLWAELPLDFEELLEELLALRWPRLGAFEWQMFIGIPFVRDKVCDFIAFPDENEDRKYCQIAILYCVPVSGSIQKLS